MNAPTIKYAKLGSVSHGTLRPQDLIEAFHDCLEDLQLLNGHVLCNVSNPLRKQVDEAIGEASDWLSALEAEENASDENLPENADEVIEQLTDALNAFAPAYCYFGAHEGDGADFGFWLDKDALRELPKIPSGSEPPADEDCYAVNDHGNVTVYVAGEPVVEAV